MFYVKLYGFSDVFCIMYYTKKNSGPYTTTTAELENNKCFGVIVGQFNLNKFEQFWQFMLFMGISREILFIRNSIEKFNLIVSLYLFIVFYASKIDEEYIFFISE